MGMSPRTSSTSLASATAWRKARHRDRQSIESSGHRHRSRRPLLDRVEQRLDYTTSLNLNVKVLDFIKSGGLRGAVVRTLTCVVGL